MGLLIYGLVPALASAQSRDPLTIEGVFVGFPTAPQLKPVAVSDSLFKEGFWTPVYVAIKCNREYTGSALLVVEAPDCDEVPAAYAVPVPQITPGNIEMVTGYARPGGRDNTLKVFVAQAKIDKPSEPTNRLLSSEMNIPAPGMEAAQFLFLAIGNKLDGARIPGVPIVTDEERTIGNVRGQQARSLIASATDLRMLPTNWFGYDGVDLAILCTSDRDFNERLISEQIGRKAALVDWVKRGGRLIVSVGKNADQVANAGELTEILPVRIGGTAELDVNKFVWSDLTAEEPLGKLTVARCTPRVDRPMKIAVPGPKTEDGIELPLVINSSFGLGRVTVVAFDLDEKPLARWRSRESFWRELVNRSGNRIGTESIAQVGVQFGRGGRFSGEHTEGGELGNLVRTMEEFPGVPVISFGWVALFILVYIIIVGPLDYLFLKKVVKRLELTWITFPTIVLVVSAAAYYAAYALKGSHLRINKYDVVDIDLLSKQMEGRTWFTLFSPRIQNYQVGIEPSAPDWTREDSDLDVLVGWTGQSRYNTRQSLFRRSYEYLPRATGLKGVPVQVWSTKGFQGQWFAPMDLTKPLATADLRRPPGGKGLIGSITLNLPESLDNVHLIEAASMREPTVRALGSLLPGIPKTIASQEPQLFSNWAPSPGIPGWFPVNMFFYDLCSGKAGQSGNASLRDVDMSWRFNGSCGDVAILVGTFKPQEGNSADVAKLATNPSRLWLGAFPRTGVNWPSVDGQLKQATCVRIVIPIRSSDAVQP